jgi:DNA-binding response OmpR family regulator
MKILLLEDDISYKETIHEYLETLGYSVQSFENGNDVVDAIHDTKFDLLLLDIRVPGMSGYDIVKMLRENKNNVPVIFITSLTDINNLSIGYELGCNDYIRKPFAAQELKYRVEQVLKLFYFHSNEKEIDLGNEYIYKLEQKALFYKDDHVVFTPKEQELLDYLIMHLNEYISTKRLWEDVWQEKMVTEADIRMCIKKIRDKTEADFIISKKGFGYKIDRKR